MTVSVNAQLGRLVELIGLPMALRLVDNFGGVPIYVPHLSRVKADGKVAEVIGIEAMRKLAVVWPSEHVMIPRGVEFLRRRRAAEIHAKQKAMSVRELALEYEMTERNVYLILADKSLADLLEFGDAGDDAQASLF